MMMSRLKGATPKSPPKQEARRGIAGPTTRGDMRHNPPSILRAVGGGQRVLELDALRGLACLVILVYHLMPHRVPGGWAGVDLFFILSGFLITSIILKSFHERRFLAHFYMRRGLRIWPVYYLTVLLLAAATPILPRPYDLGGLPYLLTYTQNVPFYWSKTAPQFASYLMHTWSLAIEEQFYLIWPPLICIVGRRGVVPLSLALAFASVWARAHGFHWWLLLARGDGLAMGSLLAVLLSPGGGEIRQTTLLRWAFGTGSVAAMVYLIPFAACGGMSTLEMPMWPASTVLVVNLFGFGVVGLVVCLQGHPALRPLRSRWLVKAGQLSYGLYMYHYVILLFSDDLAQRFGLGGRPFWRQALTSVAIFALATLSWRYVERPFLRLKDRFSYGPSANPHGQSPHVVGASQSNVS
jgi:peptidoglycan/LPS O-acetylase OafA/YrhL